MMAAQAVVDKELAEAIAYKEIAEKVCTPSILLAVMLIPELQWQSRAKRRILPGSLTRCAGGSRDP